MKSLAIILIVCSSVLCLPRQDVDKKNQLALDEPLSDPELRRTLLRVFAESLRAAAESGIPGPRSAVNVPVEEIIDLAPPANDARAELGFAGDQGEELLLLSGDSDPPRPRALVSFTTAAPVLQSEQQQSEASSASVIEQRGLNDDDLVSIRLQTEETSDPQRSQNSRSDEPANRETTSESSSPSEPTFPGPSPAPPSPTTIISLDDAANTTQLSVSDKKDVERFLSASSNTTDEKLGDGVELFQAPLIAAFALQQDGQTGRTRSLYALPIARGVTEELLKSESQTLSVAGQVIGAQKSGIVPQPSFRQPNIHNFGRTVFDIQRSIQPTQQFSQFDSTSFLSNEVEPLRELERRQQQLQQELLRLQRERSAILLQRNTRSHGLQTSASEQTNIFTLPIYLQPPFF